MSELVHDILKEICLKFVHADYQKELQKFVLSGKSCFLTYVEVFKSVQEVEFDSYGIIGVSFYYTPPDWVTGTLGMKDHDDISVYITDDHDEWDHALMLLGRYGKNITLPYVVVYPFYDGVAMNKDATEISNCHLPADVTIVKALQDYRIAEKAPPLEKISVAYEFFEELAKMPDVHLKVEKCSIFETTPFSQYLRIKNFTAEELILDNFDMKNFVDTRYQRAVKHLSRNLRKVKKITIESHCENHQRRCPILAVPKALEIFKKMFPALEDFEIEILDHLKQKKGVPIRMKRLEEALKCKSFLHLKVCARMTDSPYNKTMSVEKLRKKFPQYEVGSEDDVFYPCFVLQKEINSRRSVSLKIEFPYWKTNRSSCNRNESEEDDEEDDEFAEDDEILVG